jgi:DNA-binding transcriptional ArsR family regulator
MGLARWRLAVRIWLRQPHLYEHLPVLRSAGIVDGRPVAQRKVCQLQTQSFQELDTWVDTFLKSGKTGWARWVNICTS